MKCKKCGNEIEEGNSFCTNCGTEINKKSKEPIKIKLSTFIVLILLIIVLFCIILFILKTKNNADTTINGNSSNEQINTLNTNNEVDNIAVISDETYDNTNENTVDLIEQIYTKYPELEGKDGIICYNTYNGYTDYWLLDKDGKKLYFSNMENFEVALEKCPSAKKIIAKKNTTSKQQNVTTNNSYNETKRLYTSLLTHKMEEEVKALMAEKNISYTIEYKEVTSYKDGQVYDYKIISNREKEKKNDYFEFQEGESLIIYVSKYNNKTVNYIIDIASIIAEYTIECTEKNLSMNTNTFTFDLKINDNLLYSKTISNAEAKKAMKTDKEIEDYPRLRGYIYFDNSYETLNATYTGYGILNTKLYVNGVLLRNQDYNIYKEEYYDIDDDNHRSAFIILKEGNDDNTIYMRFYGTLGNGGW